MEDSELVALAKQGDKLAFDKLMRKHYNKVSSLVNRYVKDKTEALDVTQDSFLKAYRGINSFKEDSSFYTWLYRIASNTAKNHLTYKSRRVQCSSVDSEDFYDESILSGVETPENLLQTEQLKESIEKAVEGLPEALREALTLREVNGLSYQEIAEKMSCPVGTIRSRISRAREVLANQFKSN